jgi:phage terminase large subunit-like protein
VDSVDWWDACRGDFTDAELLQLPVFPGFDMAQKHDLASLVLTFPRRLEEPAIDVTVVGGDDIPTKRVLSLNFAVTCVPFFWIPEDTMREHEKSDGVPYEQWVKAGLVTATPGPMIDENRIIRDIKGPISERFPRIREATFKYDPAFATSIAINLMEAGFRCVELLQNYKYLSEPSMVFESLIRAKRVRHNGQRVLRWNMENVSTKSDDAGRIRPVKPKRQSKRIDGCVASIFGIDGVIRENWGSDGLLVDFA